MSNTKIAKTLKVIIILMGLLGLVTTAFVIPMAVNTFTVHYPELSYFALPWTIFLLCCVIPLYAVLVFGWNISDEIGRNNSFTEKNAKSMRGCAYSLGGDAIFFFVGNIVLGLMNMNHPGVALASAAVSAFVFMIACATNLLAHLVSKASAIREENEGFI